MMKGNDKMTDLFRSRLAGVEMEVRDGFWEELEKELLPAVPCGRRSIWSSPRFHRVAAAASVLMVLGVASAAFWYFSPKEEIKEAFTQVAILTPEGNLKGDVAQESFPSIHQAAPISKQSGAALPAGSVPTDWSASEDDESLSLHVSITITQRVYGNGQQTGDYLSGKKYAHGKTEDVMDEVASGEEKHTAEWMGKNSCNSGKWALKTAIGSSLPKGDCHFPLTLSVTAERRLNKSLSLEAGLQYNYLSGQDALHTLGIPVKLNLLLANTPKVDFYATVGGMAEKCIAGAPDNSFQAEPVQLSTTAGVGVRYKMNDRFALFVEPTVSHHFGTDSKTRTLRTERPTNLNLLCGVRMTY